MSTNEAQDMPMGTKPVKEHEWLKNLIGEWRTEAEMMMAPDQPPMQSSGTETVTDLGGLWAIAEGRAQMPGGEEMIYKSGIGYDVSFKEYRGFWVASVSSHLWKYTGEMSADGKKLTLNCVGPHMEKDGETANYRDVHELIDDRTRTMTSFGQQDNGEWTQFMKVEFTRM
jgi:hypothetical protein